MTSSKASLVVALSALVIMHATFSAFQFQHWLKNSALDRRSTSMPFDIILELLLALLLGVFAVVEMFGHFEPIRQADVYRSKTLDEISYRPQFVHFNHRGKILKSDKLNL